MANHEGYSVQRSASLTLRSTPEGHFPVSGDKVDTGPALKGITPVFAIPRSLKSLGVFVNGGTIVPLFKMSPDIDQMDRGLRGIGFERWKGFNVTGLFRDRDGGLEVDSAVVLVVGEGVVSHP